MKLKPIMGICGFPENKGGSFLGVLRVQLVVLSSFRREVTFARKVEFL